MGKKVGIPRGLFYYQFYPLWNTFFEELGAEIAVSDHTTKKILDDGVKACIDEACLPVKIFHGHVINLKDRVDYLFIPRFTSISRGEYICPKFGGLPDMVRNSIRDLPEIIDTEVNLRKSGKYAMKSAFEAGCRFCSRKSEVKRAFNKAMDSCREYQNRMLDGLLPCDILGSPGIISAGRDDRRRMQPDTGQDKTGHRLHIAVISHTYNINDSYSSMGMVRKLRESGATITTVEMVPEDIIHEKSGTLSKRMFWDFGRKALGGAMHLIEREDIDGIIYVMSFGCGVDSFVCDMVERRIRGGRDIPFIVLTLDEHSGEAGMNTRLEAFTDMIRWRKKKPNKGGGR